MNNKITVFFVFLLLFFVLQLGSWAQMERFERSEMIFSIEEDGNTRHVDTYYCVDDASAWLGELGVFRDCFTSDDPGIPTFAITYVPRLISLSTKEIFSTRNNDYVDTGDLVYFCGHGGNFGIRDNIYLPDVPGWGDKDMEFILFQSCSVIPSPDDVEDWASPWWEHDGKGIFQGLHIACGLRSKGWAGDLISAEKVGAKLRRGLPVIQAWFLGQQEVRTIRGAAEYPSLASALCYPGLDWDTLYDYGPDPPRDAHWLGIWWEARI